MQRIVKAWNDVDSDPAEAARDVISMLHHPYFADAHNETHRDMYEYMQQWLEHQGDEREEVLGRCKQRRDSAFLLPELNCFAHSDIGW